jgi:hypothetical protein
MAEVLPSPEEALRPLPGDYRLVEPERAPEPGRQLRPLATIGNIAKRDWFTSELYRAVTTEIPRVPVGDSFESPSADLLSAVAKEYEIPPAAHLLEELAEAESETHMRFVAQQIRRRLDIDAKIHEEGPHGLSGFMLRLGVNMFDPIPLVAGYAAGRGPAAAWGATASTRTGAVGRKFLANGAFNTAIDTPFEFARVAMDPAAHPAEVGYSLGGSFILGGILGQFAKLTPKERAEYVRVVEGARAEMAATMRPESAVTAAPERLESGDSPTPRTRESEIDEWRKVADDASAREDVREYARDRLRELEADVETPPVRVEADEPAPAAPRPRNPHVDSLIAMRPQGDEQAALDAFEDAAQAAIGEMTLNDFAAVVLARPDALEHLSYMSLSQLRSRARVWQINVAGTGTQNQMRTAIKKAAQARAAEEPNAELPPLGGSGGAARTPIRNPVSAISERRDAQLGALPNQQVGVSHEAGYAFGGAANVGTAGRLNNSPDNATRHLSQTLMPEMGGLRDGQVVRASGYEYKERLRRVLEARYLRQADRAFREWLKRRKMGSWGYRRRGEFMRMVGDAIRDPDQSTFEPEVLKAADSFRRAYADALDYLQNSLVEVGGEGRGWDSFEGIPKNDKYLPRYFDQDAIQALRKRHGDAFFERLIAESILEWRTRNGQKVTPEDVGFAERTAASYWKTVFSAPFQEKLRGLRFVGGEVKAQIADLIRTSLKEAGEDIDDARLGALIDLITPNRSEKEVGPAKRAMFRTGLLESHVKAANDGSIVRLSQIFDNDAERVFRRYVNETMGYAALARVGVHTITDLKAKINDIKARAGKAETREAQKRMEDDANTLLHVADIITGGALVPREAQSRFDRGFTRAVSILKRLNFMRFMNLVGFSQMAEVGIISTRTSVRGLVQALPALDKFYKQVRAGETVDDDIMALADSVFGYGAQQVRSRVPGRESLEGIDPEFENAPGIGARLDDLSRKGANWVARSSAMAPITEGLQLLGMRWTVQLWAKAAREGRAVFSPRRLALLGIDAPTLENINRNLANAPTGTSPMTGRQFANLDFTSWDDPRAAQAFLNAVDRDVRRMVLEGDLGGLFVSFQKSHLASILLQFRNFSLNSYKKHILFGTNTRDVRALMEFLMGTFGGALGYMARVAAVGYVGLQGEEYVRERMTYGEIAKGAFYYSTHSSIVPGMWDTATTLAGFEPTFAWTRQSMLPSDFITGNPTVSFANDIYGGFSDIAKALRDPSDKLDREDARKLMRALIPFYNSLYMQALLNPILSELPPDDDR